jgi:hypothetical protein
MNNISITPSKNNIGAYVENVNLKNMDQDQADKIKNTLTIIFLTSL